MFTKQKCNGCRKQRYFVKKREIRPKFTNGDPITSTEALCRQCYKDLKKFNYV